MSKLLFASIFCLLALSVSHSFADELTIEGIKISRDVACSSQDIAIYGADNTIQLTGQCGNVTIQGSKHQVTFESATTVTVSGADNQVSGGETQSLLVDTSKNQVKAILKTSENSSKLEVSGIENSVEVDLQSPTKIDVSGAKHQVVWQLAQGASKPETSISGADNIVKEKKSN